MNTTQETTTKKFRFYFSPGVYAFIVVLVGITTYGAFFA